MFGVICAGVALLDEVRHLPIGAQVVELLFKLLHSFARFFYTSLGIGYLLLDLLLLVLNLFLGTLFRLRDHICIRLSCLIDDIEGASSSFDKWT